MSRIYKIACFSWLITAGALQVQAQEFIGPHGYLTFEAEISNKDSVGERGTFDLHHFNLLGNFLISAKSRVFGEIEWEHGADSGLEGKDGGAVGHVRIERAWFEFAHSERFKLRIGKFLSPFGIYNIVHDAAPAYDTSILPNSIYGTHLNPFGEAQRFYAKFANGLQVLGTLETGSTNLNYRVFVSNGRGNRPFEEDDNGNKGLGLRLISDVRRLGVKIGYSFYSDRNGLAKNTRQTSHGWDLRLQSGRWSLNSEFALFSLARGKGSADNQTSHAGYGELAYRFLHKQTIVLRYDLFDAGNGSSGGLEKDLTIGTSLQWSPGVLFKAEAHFIHQNALPRRDYILAISSLAVVF